MLFLSFTVYESTIFRLILVEFSSDFSCQFFRLETTGCIFKLEIINYDSFLVSLECRKVMEQSFIPLRFMLFNSFRAKCSFVLPRKGWQTKAPNSHSLLENYIRKWFTIDFVCAFLHCTLFLSVFPLSLSPVPMINLLGD